jgi:hypothetical protein
MSSIGEGSGGAAAERVPRTEGIEPQLPYPKGFSLIVDRGAVRFIELGQRSG